MNLAVISGNGWLQHQSAVHALLERLAATKSTDAILLDFDAISREVTQANAAGNQAYGTSTSALTGYVPFAKWMKDARLAEDVIDTNAILSTATMIPAENIVIIDAHNYGLELILAALEKARLAWYPLDTWHPTFAVIADDVCLLRLLPVLANTFYSQPQVLSDRETRLIVKAMMRRASIYRWFGPRGGRTIEAIEKTMLSFIGVKD
ncbi:MAG: hypothetical protein WCG16_14010 [Methylococcales bacterium]